MAHDATDLALPEHSAPRIETRRLSLELLAPAALRAIAEGRLDEASRLTGCDLTAFPEAERGIAAIRLKDLAADPDYLSWSLRLLRLKPDLRFAGYFNFHTRPDPDYLRALAPGAVELGYYVLPEFRRRGLAEEMALGMMDWAARTHGIGRFVVSISPGNAPSVAMARKLGFARIGGHVDETDGYEDILSLDISTRTA
jgi:[ribosomal protein S5]-alanine N-acetyltransferase